MRKFHPDSNHDVSEEIKAELDHVTKLITTAWEWIERKISGQYPDLKPFVGFSRDTNINGKKARADNGQNDLNENFRRSFEYDQDLTKVSPKELRTGDYLHLRTRKSYYVFEVYQQLDGNVCARYHSGPSTLSGADGAIQNQVIQVGIPFLFGDARTSPVERIQVSKNRKYKISMLKN